MEFNEFFFVFLKKKVNFVFQNDEIKQECYKGHFEFQRTMMLAKKLMFSGPLEGTGGLYFFSTMNTTKQEIEKTVLNDPLVKIGLFIPEVHKFF